MHKACKFIKKATGKTIFEFCETELNSEYKAFTTRLNSGKIKPSEALYIAYVTNKPIKELFSQSFDELFLLRGDLKVSESVRNIFSGFSEDEKTGFLNMIREEGDVAPFKLNPPELAPKKQESPTPSIKEGNVPLENMFIETYK